MMRVLVISALGREAFTSAQLEQFGELERPAGVEVDIVRRLETMSDSEFVELARPYHVVALTRRPMPYIHRATLDRLPNLEVLVVHTTGVHWIDIDHLTARGVGVFSLGGYATESVAEHTLASILMLSRRTHLSLDRARGLIGPSVSLRGFELRGKTIGLVGFGRIGRRLHELLAPFDVTTLIHDPAFDETLDLVTVLDGADILVLAASSTYGRPPIIGAAELQRTEARYVVNTVCDELVDHHAVVKAVRDRRLDGYVLDEFDEVLAAADVEPGRIIQTMHTGWYSDEAMARGKEEWVSLIVEATMTIRMIDGLVDRTADPESPATRPAGGHRRGRVRSAA